MATIQLPPDFKEFFQLLNSEKVEYLLVGGHAVGYYGYPRATGDLDIWVAVTAANAAGISLINGVISPGIPASRNSAAIVSYMGAPV